MMHYFLDKNEVFVQYINVLPTKGVSQIQIISEIMVLRRYHVMADFDLGI